MSSSDSAYELEQRPSLDGGETQAVVSQDAAPVKRKRSPRQRKSRPSPYADKDIKELRQFLKSEKCKGFSRAPRELVEGMVKLVEAKKAKKAKIEAAKALKEKSE